jgi:hypothetical protein
MGWGGQIMCPFQQQQQAFLFIFLCIWLFISQKEVARGLDIFSYDNVQGSLGSRHFSPALAIFSSLRSSFSFSQTPKFSFYFYFYFSSSCSWWLVASLVVDGWQVDGCFGPPFFSGSLNFFSFDSSDFSFPSLRQLSSRAMEHLLGSLAPCMMAGFYCPTNASGPARPAARIK